MQATPIAIADPPLRNSSGLHAPYALRTIVELVSEDGISGFAETHGGGRILDDIERSRPLVVGCDAYDLGRLRLAVNAEHGHSSQTMDTAGSMRTAQRVFGALEVAALDLIGKATGRPVCDLLGGRVRDEVFFSAYLFYKHAGGGGEGDDAREDRWGEALTPEDLASQAQRMVAEYGFPSVKLKGGVFPPETEIETVMALRDALGPEMPIRIDPNAAWTVETSIRVAQSLAGVLEYFEDPTPHMDGMSAVRRELCETGHDIPLATNMVVTSFADVAEAVQKDAVQVILGDHHYWGGLRAITHLGQLCETFDIGLSMHSNSHLGLSLLAMAHVATATPHLSYACDTHYPWQDPADEILIGGPVPIRDGSVRVGDEPGLGAEIDRDALARGYERYRQRGYRERDDVTEMRKHVDPNWEKKLPRW